MNVSHQCALQVAQQAIAHLLQWAGGNLPDHCQSDIQSEEAGVTEAKRLLGWNSASSVDVLKLLFDQVCLPGSQPQEQQHYTPLMAIANSDPQIPYPVEKKPDDTTQNTLRDEIKKISETLKEADNWKNLSLLMVILEKYGSCLSFGEPDVALVDQVRMTGAIAAALAQSDAPEQVENLSLIAGDLSGIQQFIYTIASDGALKSLRARSFYLELVTEEVVQQLLSALDLPRTSIIYAGGGNLYLLAPITSETASKVQQVQEQFNRWFLDKFQKKIFLALVHFPFPVKDVATTEFVNCWEKAIRKLNQQKNQKFAAQISDVLRPSRSYEQTCRVCHRDDVEEKNLKPLKEPDSPLACSICRRMFQLGDDLFDVRSMVRSHRKDIEAPVHTVEFQIGQQSSETVYYHLFKGSRPIIQDPQKLDQSVIAYLINNWDLNDYQFRYFQENVVPMLLGNYGQQVIDQNTRQPRFMRAEEMAAGSQGIDRVGYLRMDVDRLGQIFARGLQSSFSLPRLAGLSRQMSYFFKVYLNSLAEQRSKNLPANAQTLKSSPDSIPGDRPNLLFIYAGGDDLFVSGAWNEVVEFAFDVYQAFRAYTGNNPAITLSGGISIETEKFPLYQAAEAAGSAEKAAKGGGRDRLGLFAEVLQWSEWLGATQPTMIQELMKGIYENVARAVIDRPPGNEQQWEDQIQEIAQQCFEPDDPKTYPVWLGVLPLVQRLYQHQDQYSSSFIRNLLLTAQLQKQRLDEKQKQIDALKKKNQLSGDDPALLNARIDKEQLRYYLHLPQIAYTLRLLGESSGKEENEQDGTKESPLEPVRKSLKSPYNAPYFRAIATWIELLTRTSEP